MKKTESATKRFIIYTRCSTDEQAQGDFTTLDAQTYHCKNILEAKEYKIAIDVGNNGVVIDDGYSGKDLKRPGIQSILNQIHNGERKFDGIIFHRLDRLTRNMRDLYSLIDLFREHDIDFLSVKENVDTSSPFGRMLIGILGSLSSFERENIGERVRSAALARVRQGIWLGGTVPLGYKLIKDGEPLPNGKQPHKIIIDKEIGPQIKLLWVMAADNKSLGEIAHELIKRGTKPVNGKNWHKQSIATMLKNPFYKGYLRYAKEVHKGLHPALVDEALWDKANKLLSAKMPGHRFVKKPKIYNYLVSGILKCGKCGSHFVATCGSNHSGEKFFYYFCPRSKQKLGCDASPLSATAFDNGLIDYFKRASTKQEVIMKAIGNSILASKIKLGKIEKALREFEDELKTTKDEANKLLDLALKDALPQGSIYKAKMTAFETKITVLEDRIAKLQAQKNVAQLSADSSDYLYSNIQSVMFNVENASSESRKNALMTLIKEVLVYNDHAELKMYLWPPPSSDSTLAPLTPRSPLGAPENNLNMPKNKRRPINKDGAPKTDAAGLFERHVWLPPVDSNHN